MQRPWMPLFSELSANLPDGHTILYIEDNLASIRLIEEILHERTDIEFLNAREGQIGLALARQRSPDLVLLDLGLPDLPGLDVLSQLQSAEATRRIPVVVISPDAATQKIDQLAAVGARAYLTKPIEVPAFLHVLDGLLTPTSTGSQIPCSRPGSATCR